MSESQLLPPVTHDNGAASLLRPSKLEALLSRSPNPSPNRRRSIVDVPSAAAAMMLSDPNSIARQKQNLLMARSTGERDKEVSRLDRQTTQLGHTKRAVVLVRQTTLVRTRKAVENLHIEHKEAEAELVKTLSTFEARKQSDQLMLRSQEDQLEAAGKQKEEMRRKLAEWEHKKEVAAVTHKAVQKTLVNTVEGIDRDILAVTAELEQLTEWLRKPKEVHSEQGLTENFASWIGKLKVETLRSHKQINDLKKQRKEIQQLMKRGDAEDKEAEAKIEECRLAHLELVANEENFKNIKNQNKQQILQRDLESAAMEKKAREWMQWEKEQAELAAARAQKAVERKAKRAETPGAYAKRQDMEMDQRRADLAKKNSLRVNGPGFGSGRRRSVVLTTAASTRRSSMSKSPSPRPSRMSLPANSLCSVTSPAAGHRRRSMSKSPNARASRMSVHGGDGGARRLSKSPMGARNRRRSSMAMSPPTGEQKQEEHVENVEKSLKIEVTKMGDIQSKVQSLEAAKGRVQGMKDLANQHKHDDAEDAHAVPLEVESAILNILAQNAKKDLAVQKDNVRRRSVIASNVPALAAAARSAQEAAAEAL